MALQKLASSFSSGGNGMEQSSPTSTRSFSGSIRGFLQSLRAHAGLSADATSPRGSRTGYLESSRPGTPPVSGAQQAYAPILASLHTESDESDTEQSTKWLTSSAHGILGFPTEVAPSTSSARPSIFRSYSSKRSKGAATPVFVTSSGNKPSGLLPCSAEVPNCSKGTSASAFSSGGTRLSSASRVASRTRELLATAAGAFTSDNVSPPHTATIPAAFTPTPISSTSLTQRCTAPSALQLSLAGAPLSTSCSANAAIPPDPAAPLAVYPPTSQLCAQPNELLKTFGSAQSLLLMSDLEICNGGSIPGSHAQSSVAAASAGAAQPVMDYLQVLMPQSRPPAVKSTASDLSGSVDGTTTPNSIDVQGAICSTFDKATSADDNLAAGCEDGKESETAEQQECEAVGEGDAGVGNDVVSAMVLDVQATTVERSSPFKTPATVELSPVAVSQAVQRLQLANSGGQWEEWLEEAPYMSGGRAIPSLSALEAMRGSVSYTEGQASGADRLQAMMNSAASGDAASYLQQLLLPDNNSTASREFQYSGTQAHVASALPYGSSCGAAYGLGGAGGIGSAARMHSEIANGFTGADAGLWSGLGLGVDEPSVRAHSSSRVISGFVGSYTVCGISSPMGSQLLGRRPKSAVVGGPAVFFASQAGRYDSNPSCPHAHKSAMELFEELRQSYDNAATSQTTACSAPSVAPEATSKTGSLPADDDDDIEELLLREQLREELQEALWRLVRAKNAEAVSFLLVAGPAAKANRPLVPLLKDLRSWMYTNMW